MVRPETQALLVALLVLFRYASSAEIIASPQPLELEGLEQPDCHPQRKEALSRRLAEVVVAITVLRHLPEPTEEPCLR